MIEITNDILIVQIAEKGAEIQSIKNQTTGLEYMWNGNPQYWGKHSPVLFPIVGGLKDNQYTYNGKQYHLGRHGFARDVNFTVIEKTRHSVLLGITDTEENLKKYPFHFQFTIQYVLHEATIIIRYGIKNLGKEHLLFSVGAHPAFNVPLTKGTEFEDYYLQFETTENAPIFPLDDHGMTELEAIPFLKNTDTLPLQKSLFYKDALVFKSLQSKTISIKNDKNPHGLTVAFAGFPFMGIWSAKDADFVCIEPWHGIADNVATSGNLEEKEGIITLLPAQAVDYSWSITTF